MSEFVVAAPEWQIFFVAGRPPPYLRHHGLVPLCSPRNNRFCLAIRFSCCCAKTIFNSGFSSDLRHIGDLSLRNTCVRSVIKGLCLVVSWTITWCGNTHQSTFTWPWNKIPSRSPVIFSVAAVFFVTLVVVRRVSVRGTAPWLPPVRAQVMFVKATYLLLNNHFAKISVKQKQGKCTSLGPALHRVHEAYLRTSVTYYWVSLAWVDILCVFLGRPP